MSIYNLFSISLLVFNQILVTEKSEKKNCLPAHTTIDKRKIKKERKKKDYLKKIKSWLLIVVQK